MQLGIYAPYNVSETTTAAIQLASLAMSMDLRVSFLTTGERSDKVHDYWDHRVRTNPKKHFESWATHSDRCVWFVPNRRRLEQALAIRTNTSHILVPPWHQLGEGHINWIHWYDHIACPTPESEFRISETSGHLEFTAFNCPWPSNIVPSVRDSIWDKDRVKFFFPIDAATQKENAGDILKFVEMVLTNNPNAEITMVPSRSWPRDLKKRISWLLGYFKGRFFCRPGLDMSEHLQVARRHDCVLALDTRINLAADISRYKSVGLPVIAWEAEPTSFVINNEVNGLLVPATVEATAWGAESVYWSSPAAAQACTYLCQAPDRLVSLMGGSLNEESDAEEFRTTWGNLLDPAVVV